MFETLGRALWGWSANDLRALFLHHLGDLYTQPDVKEPLATNELSLVRELPPGRSVWQVAFTDGPNDLPGSVGTKFVEVFGQCRALGRRIHRISINGLNDGKGATRVVIQIEVGAAC